VADFVSEEVEMFPQQDLSLDTGLNKLRMKRERPTRCI